MRHRRRTEKLGRTTAHKKSMMSNLLVSLIKNEKIQTTEAKGKALKRHFDRVVSLAIKGDNASLREVISYPEIRKHLRFFCGRQRLVFGKEEEATVVW